MKDLKCCRVTYKDIWGNTEQTNYYLEQDENFIEEVFMADYGTAKEIIDFEFID